MTDAPSPARRAAMLLDEWVTMATLPGRLLPCNDSWDHRFNYFAQELAPTPARQFRRRCCVSPRA